MKDSSSISLYGIDDDLGKINITIKKLKIERSSIRIPFSFLNNLEELDLDHVILDIYDLPKNKTNLELANIKSLSLSNSQFFKDLNIKFSIPNLTNLSIEWDEDDDDYIDIESNLVSLFDIYNYNVNIIYNFYEENINQYFNKFVGLKDLYVYWYSFEGNHGEYFERRFHCKKIKNNIIKCNYDYIMSCDENYRKEESFFFDPNNSHRYRVKTQLYSFRDYYHFDWGNDYEEIIINGNYKYEFLFEQKILENDNYSLQVIDITDDKYDILSDEKEFYNFGYFVKNVKKFLVLRKINIELTNKNYKEFFDSEELEILIKNLSTLKLLEKIKIKIHNPNIKLSKESSKLFNKMKIQNEKEVLSLFWKYE